MQINNKFVANERNFIMLKRFTFRNCYSFKDETVFSMEADYALKDNVDFIITTGKRNARVRVLPVAAIYGANAGGKSNLIRALTDAARNICKREPLVNNIPFLITDKYDDNFEHKLNFIIGDYEYEYHYCADDAEFIEEALRKRSVGSRSVFEPVFVRKGSSVIDIDKSLNEEDSVVIKASARNTESLVINHAGAIGVKHCAEIFHWCESIVSITRVKGDAERSKHLDEFADSLGRRESKSDEIDRLSRFISKFDPAIQSVCTRLRGVSDNENEKRHHLVIRHNIADDRGGSVGFPVKWESNGTQKILELYPTLIDVLDNGKTLVFDELDTMLHPLIFKKLVALFNSKIDNPKNAQLIFAAHNTIVMNREDLRRDEIHIVKKDNGGNSYVYRLSDFVDENGKKIRMDASYDRMYLEGMLGSIPEEFFDADVRLG